MHTCGLWRPQGPGLCCVARRRPARTWCDLTDRVPCSPLSHFRAVLLRRVASAFASWLAWVEESKLERDALALATLHHRHHVLAHRFGRWGDFRRLSLARRSVLASVDAWACKRLLARTFRGWLRVARAAWRDKQQVRIADAFWRLQHLSRSFGPWRSATLWHAHRRAAHARLLRVSVALLKARAACCGAVLLAGA